MKINLAVVCLLLTCFATVQANHVWINELHYDNDGADESEFVEVVIRDVPGGQDLSDVGLYLYNGSSGAVYDSITLDDPAIESTPGGAFSYHVWKVSGIQNGAPDGVALTLDGVLAQFLSYEGSFTGTDGPAIDISSIDIGVAEGSAAPLGSALALTGSGTSAIDFVWSGPQDARPGAANLNQTLVPEPGSAMLLALGALGLIMRRRSR